MISFAVKFHSFFGTKDHLYRRPDIGTTWDDVAKVQGGNEGGDDGMSDMDGTISNELPA